MTNQSKNVSIDEHYGRSPAKEKLRKDFSQYIDKILRNNPQLKEPTVLILDGKECNTLKSMLIWVKPDLLQRLNILSPNDNSQGHCEEMQECISNLKAQHPYINVEFKPNTEFADALKNDVIHKRRCLIAAFADFTGTYIRYGKKVVDLLFKHGILFGKDDTGYSMIAFTFCSRNAIVDKNSDDKYQEAKVLKSDIFKIRDSKYIHINRDDIRAVDLQPYGSKSAMWNSIWLVKRVIVKMSYLLVQIYVHINRR